MTATHHAQAGGMLQVYAIVGTIQAHQSAAVGQPSPTIEVDGPVSSHSGSEIVISATGLRVDSRPSLDHASCHKLLQAHIAGICAIRVALCCCHSCPPMRQNIRSRRISPCTQPLLGDQVILPNGRATKFSQALFMSIMNTLYDQIACKLLL